MNDYKVLNIRGTALDRNQLEKYIEKIASNHIVGHNSNPKTYPVPRLKDNFKFITKTYNLLNEHIKLGIDINPAGEWLLDNYYILEETVQTISKEITLKKYKSFTGIINPPYAGFARIYVLASEIVAYTDNKIDFDNLKYCLQAYQQKKTLTMDEIWSLQLFLQIAIIENIRNICENIYSSQLQKYRVESIVERLVEKKDYKNQKYKINHKEQVKSISYREMKYPFIEYMSYKLKKYGKNAICYLNILEEQVNKMGTTVEEVIAREHFLIATSKVSIGNSITSLKEIGRLNLLDIFENINGVEEILNKDPADVYSKMDYKSKAYYREKIEEISKKTKISEIYIANKIIELASRNNLKDKEKHLGYYLISDGITELYKVLQVKYKPHKNKETKYILSIFLIPLTIVVILAIYTKNYTLTWIAILIALFSYLPITQIYIQFLNYILSKTTKAKLIPKLDFSDGIPKEDATFVCIPTIINSAKKVNELMEKLEIYYIANKSENLYFALLGDTTASKNEKEDFDKEVELAGCEAVNKLNEKYKTEGFPIFHFLYRQRIWNSSERIFLGWERKRGLLNQFNSFLISRRNDFKVNTIPKENLPNIKYIITIDSDTELVLDSAKELIGAMSHILNNPEVEEGIVTKGHALMQPRVGIDLDSSNKSIFTKIYAGLGGVDSYSNAVSDIYQDNFDEGIFTGKGIYNLKIFHKLLNNEIPENTVLSHDLLEGSYLRCGLVNDVVLLDGYPSKYNAAMGRSHRWIRGDWQISRWLSKTILNKQGEKKKNPLNKLSRFKIFDNLRRSLIPVTAFLLIILGVILELTNNNLLYLCTGISLVSICMPTIVDILNYIIFRRNIGNEFINAYKSFSSKISMIQASIYRGILEIALLPHKAYTNLNAIIKTIYRMKISKHNLLEWTTAEEAEKQAKTDLVSYYKNMIVNLIFGSVFLMLFLKIENIILFILGLFWIASPAVMWRISKPINFAKPKLKKKDLDYLIEIGKKTWKFFEDYINEENNYLPPDNFQEDRINKIAYRTSSTNIGLGLLSVIAASDLDYITSEKAIELLDKMISTISNLSKWNGHLYNWYNTKTLQPLYPRYISSVDSGNFIGYMYCLKQYLISKKETIEYDNLDNMINSVDRIIENTNFSYLYDYKKRLFSIGFNVEENKLTDSYYDLLASEARQASLVAIAKKDIPAKHWNNLSRTLTTLYRYKGLISWSGTAFEYLMPDINMRKTYWKSFR